MRRQPLFVYVMICGTLATGTAIAVHRVMTARKSQKKVISIVRYRVAARDAPAEGSSAPKVTLVVFGDYGCGFCREFDRTVRQLFSRFGEQNLRVIWKSGANPEGLLASEAAMAAAEQGRFRAMHEKMLAADGTLDRARLEQCAAQAGLDVAKFKSHLDAHTFSDSVQHQLAEANRFGVRGTPTVFVNGRRVRGSQALDRLAGLIKHELTDANRLLASGVKPPELYDAITHGGLAYDPDSPAMEELRAYFR